MRRAVARVLPLLVLAAAASTRGGEPLYVVEQVIVSVNSTADGSGERVASLKSGERVELIERAGESVHVRLPDGKEGWLRAIYLSGDAPLKPRLAQAEAEVTHLQAQVARLQGQLAAATSARHETQDAGRRCDCAARGSRAHGHVRHASAGCARAGVAVGAWRRHRRTGPGVFARLAHPRPQHPPQVRRLAHLLI